MSGRVRTRIGVRAGSLPGFRAAGRLPRRLRAATVVAGAVLTVPSAGAVELGDWFTTPERRAAERFAAGEHEALIEEAPDARWEGLGRYGAGDAEGAAEAFARALGEGEADAGDVDGRADGSAGTSLSADERNALLYNRATAATRAGRAADALPLFDELLERDPTNADASHNREIARRLAELDEPESAEGQGGSEGESEDAEAGEGEGESGGSDGGSREPGDERSGDGTGEPDGEDASSEEGENASDETSGDEAGERDADDDASDDTDAEGRAERQAEAEAALEAERRAAAAGEGDDAGGEGDAVAASAGNTPTEREQATEQWLRRIPDDPAGLLRRRLERSHRMDYPEVRDGDRPW